MAWYAIYKWAAPFRKRPFEVNWIEWYREKLYNEWYQSLSEEDRARVDALLEKKKKLREERHARSLFALAQIMGMMCGGRYIGNDYFTPNGGF